MYQVNKPHGLTSLLEVKLNVKTYHQRRRYGRYTNNTPQRGAHIASQQVSYNSDPSISKRARHATADTGGYHRTPCSIVNYGGERDMVIA